jgi:hypothetical protein
MASFDLARGERPTALNGFFVPGHNRSKARDRRLTPASHAARRHDAKAVALILSPQAPPSGPKKPGKLPARQRRKLQCGLPLRNSRLCRTARLIPRICIERGLVGKNSPPQFPTFRPSGKRAAQATTIEPSKWQNVPKKIPARAFFAELSRVPNGCFCGRNCPGGGHRPLTPKAYNSTAQGRGAAAHPG